MAASGRGNQKGNEREPRGKKRAVPAGARGCAAVITIVSELIRAFVKRAPEHRSIPGVARRQRRKYGWGFFFCHLLLPRHGPLSPLFYPELLDSRGGKWRFFLLFTCLPVTAWSHLTPDVHIHSCIVSTELWITFFSAGWWKAMCFSFWLQLIWPCPPTPPAPPRSFSSAFCASLSSWNSGTRLTRKIGHPLVLLSPLRNKKTSSGVSCANL